MTHFRRARLRCQPPEGPPVASSPARRWADVAVSSLIAGIALSLAAPALRPLRDSKAAICLDHLHQIGAAARMYSDDWGGRLLPYAATSTVKSVRYTALLYPYYVKDLATFACPADRLDRSKNAYYVPTTYGVNWPISGTSGPFGPSPSAASVVEPAHTIWAADTAAIDPATASLPPTRWREDPKGAVTTDIYYFYLPANPITGADQREGWSSANFAGQIIRPFPRHDGRVNAAFYDGHAESVPASQFDPAVTKWGAPGCWWDNVAG